jgi:16S rRNA processing protein RimM
MEKIKIGKITSPVGLKGEVKIISYSDDPERFEMLDSVYAQMRKQRNTDTDTGAKEAGYQELLIENVRYKGSGIILKLEGIDDRNASERARGMELFMDAADLPELEQGQFYVRDIVGFEVRTSAGEVIGTLKDVLTNTAQDVYVVSRTDAESKAAVPHDIMIPGVPEFIRSVDTENKVITVELPEGLMEL